MACRQPWIIAVNSFNHFISTVRCKGLPHYPISFLTDWTNSMTTCSKVHRFAWLTHYPSIGPALYLLFLPPDTEVCLRLFHNRSIGPALCYFYHQIQRFVTLSHLLSALATAIYQIVTLSHASQAYCFLCKYQDLRFIRECQLPA